MSSPRACCGCCSSGVDPASILCLTFTKAGAAEMADRIHERLAHWVRLKDGRRSALELARARRGSGAGKPCQGAHPVRAGARRGRRRAAHPDDPRLRPVACSPPFPAEAGLTPGFRPLEGREEQVLARTTLADLLVRAESEGDLGLVRDLQALSHRLGEGGAEAFLMHCARAPRAMEALGPREGIEARLRHAFDLPLGRHRRGDRGGMRRRCVRLATLRADRRGQQRVGHRDRAQSVPTRSPRGWLRGPAERAATLSELAETVLTQGRRAARGHRRPAQGRSRLCRAMRRGSAKAARRLLRMRATARLVALSRGAGCAPARPSPPPMPTPSAPRAVVDFDDLIRRAERVAARRPAWATGCATSSTSATDHILVDEAQDTNERQWNIVRALAARIFRRRGRVGPRAGRSSRSATTSRRSSASRAPIPAASRSRRAWFAARGRARSSVDFLDLSMDRSFRSSPPILELVDRVLAELGHDALGLPRAPNPHESHHAGRPGSVTLWQPFIDRARRGRRDEDSGRGGLGQRRVAPATPRSWRARSRPGSTDPFRSVEGRDGRCGPRTS